MEKEKKELLYICSGSGICDKKTIICADECPHGRPHPRSPQCKGGCYRHSNNTKPEVTQYDCVVCPETEQKEVGNGQQDVAEQPAVQRS